MGVLRSSRHLLLHCVEAFIWSPVAVQQKLHTLTFISVALTQDELYCTARVCLLTASLNLHTFILFGLSKHKTDILFS